MREYKGALQPAWSNVSLASDRRWTGADALAEIKGNTALTPVQIRDETSAMVAIIRMCRPVDTGTLTIGNIDQVAPLVVLECRRLREPLFGKAPALHGFKEVKRFNAVLTLARRTLRRLGVHAPELPSRDELAEAWRLLADRLTHYRLLNVIGFFGFCSISGISPDQVGPDTLDQYEAWLEEWTLVPDTKDRARRTASTWNWAGANVPKFPQVRLARANMSDHYAPPWSDYQDSVVQSAEEFLGWLAGLGNQDVAEAMFSEEGPAAGTAKISRKKKPRTIETRRDCLKIGLAGLVRKGMPIDSIESIKDLVSPPVHARRIMTFHLERTRDHMLLTMDEGDVPSISNITSSNLFNIAETLRQAAIYYELPDTEIEAIADMGRNVTKPKQVAMTDKNRALLAALVQPEAMRLMLALPRKLMDLAIKMGPTVAAARLALAAVALEILIMVPLRRENLAELRLDKHLRRAHEGALIHDIFVPASEVKNSNAIEAPLPVESAELIETYLRDFRLRLTTAENPYLFPSDDLGGRQAAALAVKLKGLIEQEVGCRWNAHVARHFAVYRYLKAHPGDWQGAAALLCDDPDTVRRFYDGLTTRFAMKKYSDSVVEERRLDAAALKVPRQLRRSGKGNKS